jgi:S-adenosylmethionine/arginine decarboxylase-like enzyme
MSYKYFVYDLRVGEVPSSGDAELWIRDLVERLGFSVEAGAMKMFDSPPNAYTLIFALSASHAVIHTTPEQSWVEVTFAFCRKVSEVTIEAAVREFFQPSEMKVTSFTGSPPPSTTVERSTG